MELLINIMYCIVAVIAISAMFLEMRRCLTMMQQNSYRPERYRKWLSASGDTTRPGRLLAIAVLLMDMSPLMARNEIGMFLILLVALTAGVKLMNMRYKKPLVMTRRAWRIFSVMTFISVCVIVAVFFLFGGNESVGQALYLVAMAALGVYCGSHLLIMLAVWLLKPVENHINRKYVNDAARILYAMPQMKVVAITGSYGKTSTKHYLFRILSEQFETLMTPGSFNTTMGVVRTVREMLKPYTEVFIVEMGAKQPGDIREICDLVHPSIGIVTAVGEQHLETFKSIERVADTKFELVDSLPEGGIAVINDDFEYIRNRKAEREGIEVIRYGKESEWRFTDLSYGRDGTEFTLVGPELPEGMRLRTRLLGECNVSNLAAAVIVAIKMGVPDAKIRMAVEQIEPVEHRLSTKRTPGGVVIIDDAFNSNPHGATMACDVLRAMEGGKRIIVTPGMVELGDKQAALNKNLGIKIASSADIAIIVNEYNREALTAGLREGGMDESAIRPVDNFAAAQALLQTLLQQGDTVLYENDLPDTFK